MEKLGQNEIYSQLLGQHPILRTYKGEDLINEYTPLYTPPLDWRDIRSDCPNNSIALYVGVKSDYSQYNNLGFTATCIGGYKVFIDGNQYGNIYASDSQCNIIWSQSGINTGNNIITPSALKAHKIWIEPATEGAEISLFQCRRVASSGREQQGVLWAHFNTVSVLSLDAGFAAYNSYYNPVLLAITAKNNTLKINKLLRLGQGGDLMQYGANVEYLCTFDLTNSSTAADSSFNILTTANLEQIKLKNGTITNAFNNFTANATKLKKISLSNVTIAPTKCEKAFANNQSLEQLPNIDYSNVTSMYMFLTNAKSLKNTVLDVSATNKLTHIGCYGDSSHFMSGFKGLRVSSSAPFSGTSPQINVSYTGMDRQALVTLFNDLPTVSAGQIINITGCTGANDLTADDKAIATNKGWTVTV